jgi:hypothetical protein
VHFSFSSFTSFSSTTFSLSHFAGVVSVNRFPAIRDQPTKETTGRPIVYIGISNSICLILVRLSLTTSFLLSRSLSIIILEHEGSRFPSAFISPSRHLNDPRI